MDQLSRNGSINSHTCVFLNVYNHGELNNAQFGGGNTQYVYEEQNNTQELQDDVKDLQDNVNDVRDDVTDVKQHVNTVSDALQTENLKLKEDVQQLKVSVLVLTQAHEDQQAINASNKQEIANIKQQYTPNKPVNNYKSSPLKQSEAPHTSPETINLRIYKVFKNNPSYRKIYNCDIRVKQYLNIEELKKAICQKCGCNEVGIDGVMCEKTRRYVNNVDNKILTFYNLCNNDEINCWW